MVAPVIPTRGMSSTLGKTIDGTIIIAVTFVFLAYFLHPFVESAYNRIRAWRAWEAIQRNETVEVTRYPLHDEIFRGRRKWDSARIIAMLLVGFSGASWVLELSLDLTNVDDTPVDALDRPPPVVFRSGELETWEVLTVATLDSSGRRGEFVRAQDYLQGNSKSRYKVGKGRVEYPGSVLTAWWDHRHDMAPATLSYHVEATTEEGSTIVESLNCTPALSGAIALDDGALWGDYVECPSGPQARSSAVRPPPVLKLVRADQVTYLLVEERSNYPNFLYSVWKHQPAEAAGLSPSTSASTTTSGSVDESTEIKHLFHVASTRRVVEALVTGLVNGLDTGGECMELLAIYSDEHPQYDAGLDRAKPFGEYPEGTNIDTLGLDDLEPIERGVELNSRAILCGVLLLVFTLVGALWAQSLRHRVGMDVYNRDELIKAVTLPGPANADTTPQSMRMFVKRDEVSGRLNVVISERAREEGFFSHATRLCCRRGKGDDDSEAVTEAAPPPRQVKLEGMRLGSQRAWAPAGTRGYGPRHVCLSPSSAGSSVASSPGLEGNSQKWPSSPEAPARIEMAKRMLEKRSSSAHVDSSSNDTSIDESGYSRQGSGSGARGAESRSRTVSGATDTLPRPSPGRHAGSDPSVVTKRKSRCTTTFESEAVSAGRMTTTIISTHVGVMDTSASSTSHSGRGQLSRSAKSVFSAAAAAVVATNGFGAAASFRSVRPRSAEFIRDSRAASGLSVPSESTETSAIPPDTQATAAAAATATAAADAGAARARTVVPSTSGNPQEKTTPSPAREEGFAGGSDTTGRAPSCNPISSRRGSADGGGSAATGATMVVATAATSTEAEPAEAHKSTANEAAVAAVPAPVTSNSGMDAAVPSTTPAASNSTALEAAAVPGLDVVRAWDVAGGVDAMSGIVFYNFTSGNMPPTPPSDAE